MAGPDAGRDGVREWVGVYLRGVCMGAADTVPGVSGGTIALITGIYERLIVALTALDPRALRHLLRAHTTEGRADLLGELWAMDVPFLVVLAAGVLTSVLTLSRLMHAALATHRALTFAFFFGLILASAVALFDHVSFRTAGQATMAVVGFVVAFVVTGATAGSFSHALPVVFVAGAIAISAMILPGISGAFLLLMLGQYDYLVSTLTAFVDAALATLTGGPVPVSTGVPIVVFLAGVGVGLLTVAHLIRWALATYRRATLTFLVSLMVGALRLPVVEVLRSTSRWTPATVAATVLVAVVGGGLVLGINHYTGDLEYE